MRSDAATFGTQTHGVLANFQDVLYIRISYNLLAFVNRELHEVQHTCTCTCM